MKIQNNLLIALCVCATANLSFAEEETFFGAVGDIDWNGPALENFVADPSRSLHLALLCNTELNETVSLFAEPNAESEIGKKLERNANLEVEFSTSDLLWAKVISGRRVYDASGYQVDELEEIQGIAELWVETIYLCNWQEWS